MRTRLLLMLAIGLTASLAQAHFSEQRMAQMLKAAGY